jgi:hypothetical protein
MKRASLSGVGLSMALAALGGCAGEDSDLTTYVAPTVASRVPHTFSVFGVFRDGRMSTPAWDELSPKLTVTLGPSSLADPEPCPAAYSVDLVAENGALASAVDEYSRNYGVTEALLDRFAPAARGDLILLVVVAGASRMRRTSSLARGPRADRGGFEVTASLFSPKEHAMVAAVTLHYTGPSEDSAFSKVISKWAELFPHTSCTGWDLQTHPVDADEVRALPEP